MFIVALVIAVVVYKKVCLPFLIAGSMLAIIQFTKNAFLKAYLERQLIGEKAVTELPATLFIY